MRALLLFLLGCSRPNPLFCDIDEDCENGTVCDQFSHGCVPAPEPECTMNADCVDPLRPVCGPEQTCQACGADVDCESGVCQVDGSCLPAEEILYVAPQGASSGNCNKDLPCELLYARSRIDATQFTLLLADGSYSIPTSFDVDSVHPKAHIVGGVNVLLGRQFGGFAFRVMAGGSLSVRDITSPDSVQCIGGSLDLMRVSLLSPGSGDPLLELQSCDAVVVSSVIDGSLLDGVVARNSSTKLVNSRISNNDRSNVKASDGGILEIVGCTVSRAGQLGIDVASSTLVLRRSRVMENLVGGVRSLGGLFDVTNNFIFGNGNEQTAQFGGLRVETTLPGARVEHNTIARNDSEVTQSLGGGLFCVGATAPNNLIDGNYAGNATQPNSQVGGTCNFSGSIIRDGTVDMRYVAAGGIGAGGGSETDDYHLASADSPAVNAGATGAITEDFDGDPRSDGAPDVGADEHVP